MDLLRLLAVPLAILCAVYALFTGLTWARRVTIERAAKRKGMMLNLLRRAAPPVAAGLILLIAGGALRLSASTGLGALLIAGGLAVALHRGLADLGRRGWRDHVLTLALTTAFSLFLFWQFNYF